VPPDPTVRVTLSNTETWDYPAEWGVNGLEMT
jgi:hypothetical protein